MKARSLEEASRTTQQSHHQVDAYHAEFKRDTWDTLMALELPIDFENFENLAVGRS